MDAVVERLVSLVVDAAAPGVVELLAFTLISEETFVTPCVSSASAMAWLTWVAFSAEPLRETSPFCADTSIIAVADSESDWSFCLTVDSIVESSVAPVGAPTAASLVRTIVTPLSRSAWSALGSRRHSEMRVEISVVVAVVAVCDVLVAAVCC